MLMYGPLLVALLAALLVPPPAAAQERVLTLGNPASVTAYSGVAATSVFNAETGDYRLTLLQDGRATALPVATRRVPFDVDAGPDRGGDPVLVYSRCEEEPLHSAASDRLPDWATGRGCDIYRFDLATRREERLNGPSTRAASEYLPSIWRGRMAFARTYDLREGRRGRLPYLYVRALEGSSRREPGAARGTGGLENGPRALDLHGNRLFFAWGSFQPRDYRFRESYRFFDDQLRANTLNGSHRRLDVARGDTASKTVDFLAIQGHAGRVLYLQECRGACSSRRNGRLWRSSPAGRGREVSVLPPSTSTIGAGPTASTVRDVYLSAARTDDRTLLVRGPEIGEAPEARAQWELVALPNGTIDFTSG